MTVCMRSIPGICGMMGSMPVARITTSGLAAFTVSIVTSLIQLDRDPGAGDLASQIAREDRDVLLVRGDRRQVQLPAELRRALLERHAVASLGSRDRRLHAGRAASYDQHRLRLGHALRQRELGLVTTRRVHRAAQRLVPDQRGVDALLAGDAGADVVLPSGRRLRPGTRGRPAADARTQPGRPWLRPVPAPPIRGPSCRPPSPAPRRPA